MQSLLNMKTLAGRASAQSYLLMTGPVLLGSYESYESIFCA